MQIAAYIRLHALCRLQAQLVHLAAVVAAAAVASAVLQGVAMVPLAAAMAEVSLRPSPMPRCASMPCADIGCTFPTYP